VTRSAQEIGAGLEPARPARAIRPGERIHVVGIAGAGASAAALLAAAAGAIVSGCDPGGPSTYTPTLEATGISLAWEHDPNHVTTRPRPDRLAVTKALTAIEPDHPELRAARDLGIEGRVRWVPPVPHDVLADWYRAADVCLVPSRSESFGLVALEAAAFASEDLQEGMAAFAEKRTPNFEGR